MSLSREEFKQKFYLPIICLLRVKLGRGPALAARDPYRLESFGSGSQR